MYLHTICFDPHIQELQLMEKGMEYVKGILGS